MASASFLKVVPDAPADDGALVRAFLAGDSGAFGELLRRHQDTVFAVLRRFAPTAEDAKDLTQRAFLQAFEAARKALPAMPQSGEVPFKAWLLRIAVNLAKNHLRDTRRWQGPGLDAVAQLKDAGPSAQAALEKAQAEAQVRAAVLELPPRQREVFTLRVDAGLPFAEVAEVLGISQGNAKSNFHVAVKRLRDVVQARLSPGSEETR